MDFQPHQQRVVTEKAELDEKLDKLVAFFETGNFKSLLPDEKSRLARQCEYMGKYCEVLAERIAAF